VQIIRKNKTVRLIFQYEHFFGQSVTSLTRPILRGLSKHESASAAINCAFSGRINIGAKIVDTARGWPSIRGRSCEPRRIPLGMPLFAGAIYCSTARERGREREREKREHSGRSGGDSSRRCFGRPELRVGSTNALRSINFHPNARPPPVPSRSRWGPSRRFEPEVFRARARICMIW